ncbi:MULTISPECIES: CocE/NonD family hydrolase [unclassified Nocardia]|uniref:CocE/NonD family hydrolase n=1 Tax=unclassified Nocardia TaxID=2637762 RepID=UPI001CE3F6A9|nr:MULTISPECIES: CocE/NonD family hydrolase [unclassified Nocardia]
MTVPMPTSAGSLSADARFDIGPQRYERMHRMSDLPIRMRDGVVLSADVFRPGDRSGPTAEALPVVVNFTPYNKMFHRRIPYRLARLVGQWVGASDRRTFTGRDTLHALAGGALESLGVNPTLVKRGYAYVMVDVRGTGTSTGIWDFFSETEQRDYLEVLGWIREQPWCNGKLGLTGISYDAIAALITAGLRPDGLEAVFAIEAGENPIRELGLTGGVPTPGMIVWIAAINAAKWIPSLGGLIRTGMLRRYLRDRISDPASWARRAIDIALVENHPDGFLNQAWDRRLAHFADITVPTWIHGGWHDVYNRSNFRMYDRIATAPGAKQVVVDDSYHLTPGSGFGVPGGPQRLDELQCAWFDRWLKGIRNGIDRYGPITLRRLGDGWVSRDRYPDPLAQPRRLYLTAETSGSAPHSGRDGALRTEPPNTHERLPLPTRRAAIASNNTAILTMGIATLFGKRFGSDDRRAEVAAVTFTTPPFDADAVISGPMNLRLRAEVDGRDAFWSVVVTDVAPDGVSAAITRGALLSSLRAVDETACVHSGEHLLVAEHPCTAESVLPVRPGEPFDLDIDINVTEAVIRTGHRLRVAVSRNSFPRHMFGPALRRKISGQSILIDPDHPSYLTYLTTA